MFTKFFRLFSLNCRHKRLSQPFSAIGRKVAVNSNWTPVDHTEKGTHYVVCLDCGYRYEYDWQKMRVVR